MSKLLSRSTEILSLSFLATGSGESIATTSILGATNSGSVSWYFW